MPEFTNNPVVSVADNTNTPALKGVSSTLKGIGVSGRSVHNVGVLGESDAFDGVLGVTLAEGHSGVAGVSREGGNGVYGFSALANGVIGYSAATGHNAVAGINDDGNGTGVYGRSKKAAGVYGESAEFNGVLGVSKANGHAGVAGICEAGKDETFEGNGVYGRSKALNGVVGLSSSNVHAGVAGTNDNPAGVGIYGKGSRLAGSFDGHVEVSGNITVVGDLILPGADLAEEFGVVGDLPVEPGCVVVLAGHDCVRVSDEPYDRRVAGVVSGAGSYRPAFVLDRQADSDRRPLALTGKVWCKVDAEYAPVQLGDLLTTSPTPGHAMRAADPTRAFGAVIGKALGSLETGRGLLPVLVALQ